MGTRRLVLAGAILAINAPALDFIAFRLAHQGLIPGPGSGITWVEVTVDLPLLAYFLTALIPLVMAFRPVRESRGGPPISVMLFILLAIFWMLAGAFWSGFTRSSFYFCEKEDDAYRRSLDRVRRALDLGLKLQAAERSLVPTMLFTEQDLVVTVGQDGLVANTAKYVGEQPVVAVNPDPERFDGVLLRFRPEEARDAVRSVLDGRATYRRVTLAEAGLSDGQRLLAFNDLFIGARTHVSARYRISFGERSEPHSSSGVLVSTGAGSTGWLSSVFNMAAAIARMGGVEAGPPLRMDWEDPRLVFVVREPFASRHSRTGLAAGTVEPGQELVLESQMPQGGVIFSDGVEADALDFNSGAVARIRAAARKTRLVA